MAAPDGLTAAACYLIISFVNDFLLLGNYTTIWNLFTEFQLVIMNISFTEFNSTSIINISTYMKIR